MNCRQVSSLLSLYLDDGLDDLRRKRVQLHMKKCPACSHDLATLAKTVRLIRAATELERDGDALAPAATVNTKAKRRRQHE